MKRRYKWTMVFMRPLIFRGFLGATTYHYGKNIPYSLHEQAADAHSLFNFLVDIAPNRQ